MLHDLVCVGVEGLLPLLTPSSEQLRRGDGFCMEDDRVWGAVPRRPFWRMRDVNDVRLLVRLLLLRVGRSSDCVSPTPAFGGRSAATTEDGGS